MSRIFPLLFLLILLLGCTSETETQISSEGQKTESGNTPTLSTLNGCVPDISFTYQITTSLPESSSKAMHRFTTQAGGEVNGVSTILKTIEIIDISTGKSYATSKEWDSLNDCSCVKRETVVQYEEQSIEVEESCPAELYSQGDAPQIHYKGEEQVSVPSYKGTAKRYDLSFKSSDASYSYWMTDSIGVPVKSLYTTDDVTVLTELTAYS